jgi:hypothetical protein
MIDATTAGIIAGPLGYFAAKTQTSEFAAEGDHEPPVQVKMAERIRRALSGGSRFAAEGDVEETADAAVDAVEETADAGDKAVAKKSGGYSVWDWIVFALTIVAIVTSWTLNNDKNVRAKLGFSGEKATAGIIVSILSILAIFLVGPWMYFILLLVPVFQYVPLMGTPNNKYWIEGIKESVSDASVPASEKVITRYLSMLPQGMRSAPATA